MSGITNAPTTQPVSGTVNVANLDVALSTRLADATFTGRINTQGQKTMAASTPVVVASDQSAVPASQSGAWTVQPGNTQNTTDWLVRNRGNVTTTADGLVTAPAANAVIAEVTSLSATDYEIFVHMGTDDTTLTGRYLLAVWTDSANTVKDNLSLVPAPGFGTYYMPRLAVALNDKIRVLAGNVAALAATRYQAHIAVRTNA